MQYSESNLIWIDLEMTGLDPDSDVILEIATVVTDDQLNEIIDGPVFAIHQSDETLAAMDEWNTKHHGESGLVDRVKASSVTLEEAEAKTLEFLKQYVPAGESPMCGNTIAQDRRFLYRFMPKLEEYFHYRYLDVSTIKILAQRWAPKVADALNKDSRHIALDDIKDSIDELKYYREHFMKM